MIGHEVDLRLEHAARLHARLVALYAGHVPEEGGDAPVRGGSHKAHGARCGREGELRALELADHALHAEEEVDVRALAHVSLVVHTVELRPDPVRPEDDRVRVDELAVLAVEQRAARAHHGAGVAGVAAAVPRVVEAAHLGQLLEERVKLARRERLLIGGAPPPRSPSRVAWSRSDLPVSLYA